MITVSDVRASGEFSPEDTLELAGLTGNKSLLRALRAVLISADKLDKLSLCNLKGQEGLVEAVNRQGIVQGMKAAVEQILELTLEEDKENAN